MLHTKIQLPNTFLLKRLSLGSDIRSFIKDELVVEVRVNFLGYNPSVDQHDYLRRCQAILMITVLWYALKSSGFAVLFKIALIFWGLVFPYEFWHHIFSASEKNVNFTELALNL